MKIIKIEMTSGMECPGGRWTNISVDGTSKGRVYDDSNITLGQVIQIILKDYPAGTKFTCNSVKAKNEFKQLNYENNCWIVKTLTVSWLLTL